jgi:hypothetical protein
MPDLTSMKLSKSQRRTVIIEQETRKVTQSILQRYYSSSPEDWVCGLEALEAHWQMIRRRWISRWIQFHIVRWKLQFLFKLGHLEKALVESNRALSLPASPYSRISAALWRTMILRSLNRPAEAFKSAMSGLRICARENDAGSAQGFILNVIRLDGEGYIQELAAEHGNLVLGAMQLPNQLQLTGPLAANATPQEALSALQRAARARNIKDNGGQDREEMT